MARKKARSAKQKAATRKLVAFNKRKGRKPARKAAKRRKAPKRRGAKRKANKQSKAPKRRMVSRKGLSKITSNPTLKKILMAAGAVTVATSVAAIVAPQFVPTLQKPIVKAALGFVTGDIVGAASNFVIGGGGLGSLGGGGNGNSSQMNNGFA